MDTKDGKSVESIHIKPLVKHQRRALKSATAVYSIIETKKHYLLLIIMKSVCMPCVQSYKHA